MREMSKREEIGRPRKEWRWRGETGEDREGAEGGR